MKDSLELERVSCVICGRDDTRQIFVERGFPIVKCRQCGLVYVNPRLSKAEYDKKADCSYEELVGVSRPGTAPRLSRSAYITERQQGSLRDLRLIQRLVPGKGTLLDVGCGEGFFLKTARDAGWTVRGLEKSTTHAPAQADSLDVITADVLDCDFGPATFDVITLWDVLEHMPYPDKVIRKIGDWLRPGGIFAIRVPNATYLQCKQKIVTCLCGAGYASNPHLSILGLYAPETHFYNFTVRTLDQLLCKSGLEIERVYAGKAAAGTSLVRVCIHGLFGAGARACCAVTRGRINLNCSLVVCARKISRSEDHLCAL